MQGSSHGIVPAIGTKYGFVGADSATLHRGLIRHPPWQFSFHPGLSCSAITLPPILLLCHWRLDAQHYGETTASSYPVVNDHKSQTLFPCWRMEDYVPPYHHCRSQRPVVRKSHACSHLQYTMLHNTVFHYASATRPNACLYRARHLSLLSLWSTIRFGYPLFAASAPCPLS
jgi:hypothetical protein